MSIEVRIGVMVTGACIEVSMVILHLAVLLVCLVLFHKSVQTTSEQHSPRHGPGIEQCVWPKKQSCCHRTLEWPSSRLRLPF